MTKKPTITVLLLLYAPTPFLRAMTEFSIRALRQHADGDYKLLISEQDGDQFTPERWKHDPMMRIDQHITRETCDNLAIPMNAALDAIDTDYVVITGSDIVAFQQGWDSALLEPFEKYADCGTSCLAAKEPGNPPIGTPTPAAWIVEGMFAPFMMMKPSQRYDLSYPGGSYADSDLMMRIYESGQRSYRNNRVQVIHMNGMTYSAIGKGHAVDERFATAEKMFHERWCASPYLMYGMMRSGHIVYGQEHKAWLSPIPRPATWG